MTNSSLLYTAAACFFIAGIPIWRIPASAGDPPASAFLPGLLAIAIAALAHCAYRTAPFRRIALYLTLSFPAAILARIIIDVARDPTSHNLWPLELIMTTLAPIPFVLLGGAIGALLARRFDKPSAPPQ